MCPVNVHWHLGTEHYSYGQFDENGNGPNGNTARPEWANRDLADTKDVRDRFVVIIMMPLTRSSLSLLNGSTVLAWKLVRQISIFE